MYPHRIRLRGPWDCQRLAGGDAAAAGAVERIVMPARLGEVGRVRLERRFGFPGRIDAYEHVWLTFAAVVGRAAVHLNGHLLGTGLAGEFEFEVTPLLAARNRLELILAAEDADAGLTGEVALEVRRDAFLRGVAAHVEPAGAIGIVGFVVGTSVRPLELYALADGRHVHYAVLEARPEGQRFAASFPVDRVPSQVRVELVCVAEQWYVVEVPVAGC